MSYQGQTKIKVVLENISHELFDELLDLEKRIASSGIPCIILQWFPGNLQEYSIRRKGYTKMFHHTRSW